MLSNLFRCFRVTLPTVATLFVLASATFAGPPLICHTFDIGDAKSLPWISHDWNLSGGENYDTHNLANDTIALLDGSEVPLVHMETVRRATLYARKDPQAAKQLLVQLAARARSTKSSAHPNALAIFDAGYLAEAYKQWLGQGSANPANGLDGMVWIENALQASGNNPEIEFAAALITLHDSDAKHQAYAQRAAAGAKNDELLARNLARHFIGAQSQTMAELLRKSDETKVARQ
jgi:hypothetical protein